MLEEECVAYLTPYLTLLLLFSSVNLFSLVLTYDLNDFLVSPEEKSA